MLNEKIVRELVAYSCGVQIPNPSTLCGYAAEVIEEQAKEIEKLRAQNEQLLERLRWWPRKVRSCLNGGGSQ